MTNIDSHLAGVDSPSTQVPCSKPTGMSDRIAAWARQLEQTERECVARVSSRNPVVQHVARGLNYLGNGWLYPPVVLLLLLSGNARRYWVVVAALLPAACTHLLCPVIKRIARRQRPFSRDPSLVRLSRPLDLYSFPSGHCMTVTTVLLPVAVAFPGTVPLAAGAWTLIAWARLASAHHYPSDVVAGTVLGALVAWPFTVMLVR
jgi:undecaprenyl-diphosphatase